LLIYCPLKAVKMQDMARVVASGPAFGKH